MIHNERVLDSERRVIRMRLYFRDFSGDSPSISIRHPVPVLRAAVQPQNPIDKS